MHRHPHHPSTRRTSESGGGWSRSGPDLVTGDGGGAAEHPFRTDAATRYQPLEVAGRGGMGEVLVARDRRLGRDVALKRIVAGREGDALARRLAREAWITARLEHPSIVPVHDAGEGEDGRLYYTMRLIHGRSLGEALAEARERPQRLQLLRHFLAACEAVAYAHSHGIVHRDLKPANIMVGAFGETQVVDWGLAGFVSEATARAFAAELPLSADVSLPSAKGTPAYMSPEQARGAPLDPRADVWALGAILHEIVVGERLVPARGPEEILAQLRAGRIDRARLRESGAPGELRAIVDKATAREPAARYREAGDVAADLARYLDGGRVEAHDYTTLELARRLLRQLRVPLIAAASALCAGSIALAVSFHRVSAERRRAVGAEASARAALADIERTFAWGLARQSVAELAGGGAADADLLAAHALLRGESVDARGVAAATRAGARPVLAEAIPIPGCERVVPGTWDLALCQDDASLALWELRPARMRWRRPLKARSVMLIRAPDRAPRVVAVVNAAEVLVMDAARGEIEQRHILPISSGYLDRFIDAGDGDHVAGTEGRIISVVSLQRGRIVYTGRACAPTPVAALAPGGARIAFVCNDWRVVRWDAATGQTAAAVGPFPPAASLPLSAALSRDGGTLLAGTATGELQRIDLGAGAVLRDAAPRRVLDGSIRRIEFLGADDRVFIAGESGGALLWDLAAGAELLRLPAALSAGLRLDPRGLLTGGHRAGRFVIGGAMAPRALEVPAGISAIAIAPDGRLIAAARGDGKVTIFERATGRVVREIPLGAAVVKALDFSPDGGRLAASISLSEGSLRVFAVPGFTPLAHEAFVGGARRLAYDARGELIALPYKPPLSAWSRQGARREIPGPEMYDISAAPGRRELLMIGVDSGIWRLQGDTLIPAGRDPGAMIIAAWGRGGQIATGHDTGITVHAPGQQARWIPNPEARLTDLLVSPDERYLVGARSDGTTAVWRTSDDRLVAVLRGHRQRVASLAFAPDGLLLTAGWDGRILAWDLSVLETPAVELVAQAERAWAADLTLALRSHPQ